jgi:futalosine hydrolase
VNVLLCVATRFEAERLSATLQKADGARIIHTGVGSVNAAHALTVAILEHRPDSIMCCGIGGAYPTSGLRIGDVVCADVEIYGDLGAQSAEGFLDMEALGFPVVDGTPPLFNELPMQVFPALRRARFVTVSTCTGSDLTAQEIEDRTRGAVENMEGAAIAHVAHLHRIPAGEIRGISNMVGDRDKASWQIRQAADSAQQATLDWLRTLRP